MKDVRIFDTHVHCYSDTFGQPREKATYRVGVPNGASASCYNLSENDAISIVTNLPDELLGVVKEHYGLVEADLTQVFHLKDPVETVSNEVTVTSEVTDESLEAFVMEEGINLTELTRDQLRAVCKQLEIKGYSTWTKDEMIEAIEKEAEASDVE